MNDFNNTNINNGAGGRVNMPARLYNNPQGQNGYDPDSRLSAGSGTGAFGTPMSDPMGRPMGLNDMDDPMYDPMNNPMGQNNMNGSMNGSMGGPMGPNGMNGPMGGPMGPNGMNGPMGGPMGPNGMNGPMGGPMGPNGMNGPMGGPNGMNNPAGGPGGPGFGNYGSLNNSGPVEVGLLGGFGAPMIGNRANLMGTPVGFGGIRRVSRSQAMNSRGFGNLVYDNNYNVGGLNAYGGRGNMNYKYQHGANGLQGFQSYRSKDRVSSKLEEMKGKSLSEKIAELERMRKRHAMISALAILGVAVFIILTLFAGSTGSPLLNVMPIFFMLFAIGAVAFEIRKGGTSMSDFKALYKSVFVEDVLSKRFQNLFYSWRGGFSHMDVASFNLVRMGNRFKSEDYICATYKGVKFETSDVVVQQHTSSGKSSHTTTYFRGRMFVIYMPKMIQASIRITPDAFIFYPPANKHLEKLDMENVNFNKIFNVYASDPHYAFYILTPDMMEKMLYLKGKYGSIMMNFEGDRLFVAVPTIKDTFDADFSREINYPTERAKTEAEAAVITDIMEVLEAVPRF